MLEDPLLVDLCFNTHHQLLPNSPISRPSVVTRILENPFLVDLRFTPEPQEPFLGGPTFQLPDTSTFLTLHSRPSVVSEDVGGPFVGGNASTPIINFFLTHQFQDPQ
ncbi:hypothetical protein CEXT_361861 [Caerostris extrusa]|uniref:Uncharacterized protein n=1 Tax=Caerostris extrusa TaxID=172846 RepID=A0AAV4TZT0_CAEEX|nr:hypothetical protein CEXT_361861 [Caerostris extrusa]